MTNGYFSVQGYQVGTATSQRSDLGPFNMPFGGVTDMTTLTLAPGTTTIGIAGGSKGLAIIPPIGSPPGGVTMKVKTVIGDSGTFVSTQQPTFYQWDTVTPNVPTNLYVVVAGGNIVVAFQTL